MTESLTLEEMLIVMMPRHGTSNGHLADALKGISLGGDVGDYIYFDRSFGSATVHKQMVQILD